MRLSFFPPIASLHIRFLGLALGRETHGTHIVSPAHSLRGTVLNLTDPPFSPHIQIPAGGPDAAVPKLTKSPETAHAILQRSDDYKPNTPELIHPPSKEKVWEGGIFAPLPPLALGGRCCPYRLSTCSATSTRCATCYACNVLFPTAWRVGDLPSTDDPRFPKNGRYINKPDEPACSTRKLAFVHCCLHAGNHSGSSYCQPWNRES